MKVVWLPQAKKQLRQTAVYIRGEFGARHRDEFMEDVLHASRLLGENPYMGEGRAALGGPTHRVPKPRGESLEQDCLFH